MNSRGPLPTHERSFTQKWVLAKNSDHKEWFFMLPIWVTNFLETSSLLKITYVSALRKILKQGVNLTFQQSLPQTHSKKHSNTTKDHPKFCWGPFENYHRSTKNHPLLSSSATLAALLGSYLVAVNFRAHTLLFSWQRWIPRGANWYSHDVQIGAKMRIEYPLEV